MMKKLILLAMTLFLFAPVGTYAQKKEDADKEKPILRVSREDLKKSVKEKSNGDIMVGRIKLVVSHYPNLPPYMDSFLKHFFPSVDVKELDERMDVWKKRNADKDPYLSEEFGGLNSALARQNVRIRMMGPGEGNIRQRISAGIPLYWAAKVDYDFTAFMRDRAMQRSKVRDLSEWKKSVAQNLYKAEPIEDYRRAIYFFILGYNSKSGEFAVSTSPEDDMLFWVTPGEIRKYNLMLWEPTL